MHFLERPEIKVLVCVGSGGVGKTTVSAALGIIAAQLGRKVLVLTIDPARRLASALGLEGESLEAVAVPGQNYAGHLSAAMLNPQRVFEEFILKASPNPEVSAKLLKNRLYQEMSTTLSGSQEFTSLEYLLTAVESERYDLVILDTPPAQHAIEFLQAPERIFALFQERVTRWFVRQPTSAKLLQKVLFQGTRRVMAALEKVTGSHFISELTDFFENMAALQSTVSQRSLAVHKLLKSPQATFVLVTGFDEVKLQEAKDFRKDLLQSGHHMGGLIVNKYFPEWLQNQESGRSSADLAEDVKVLMDYYQQLKNYYAFKQQAFELFYQELESDLAVAKVPDFRMDLTGLAQLEVFAKELKRRFQEKEGDL